jgi:hypothetical protein
MVFSGEAQVNTTILSYVKDINLRDGRGRTLMHEAVQYPSSTDIDFLIQRCTTFLGIFLYSVESI